MSIILLLAHQKTGIEPVGIAQWPVDNPAKTFSCKRSCTNLSNLRIILSMCDERL
jgi:hypothetical protein